MLQRSHYHFASSACPHSPRQELELDVEAGAGLDEAHLRQDLHVLSHFRAHLEGQLQGRAGPVGGEKCGQISKALTANSFFSQCKTAICLHHNHQMKRLPLHIGSKTTKLCWSNPHRNHTQDH